MPRSKLLLAVLLLALPSSLIAAQTPPARVIEADLSKPRGALNRMYNFCVGAGRANEGLRADWQRQLRRARTECGFRYIRFHGLFCDDMGVYQEDKQGRPVYNWQYVDELFDFLTSIGMKPFVELGFMPGALASGPQTIFWYKANVTPPKDYAKWEAFIAAFTRHVTERYGADEVRSWYFEVWNEPNLTGFWMGTTGGKSETEFAPIARAEYYRLYETTARAVKSVDATYRVGGPATAGSGWIDETLAHCAENKLPLDFVSTHTYATMSGYLDENGSAGTVFSPDRNAVTGEVKGVRERMDRTAFAKSELHYTEWSSSYTPFDPIHDSYHSAAFILDKIRHIGSAATSMSYWTFTDIFEEAGPRTTPFHGGFGMLNYQDLAKPSYFAYKFLHRLGDAELVCADPDAFVCRDAAGAVQALFWDFTSPTPVRRSSTKSITRRTIPRIRRTRSSCASPASSPARTASSPRKSATAPTTYSPPGAISVHRPSSRAPRSRRCTKSPPVNLRSTSKSRSASTACSPTAARCAKTTSGSWNCVPSEFRS